MMVLLIGCHLMLATWLTTAALTITTTTVANAGEGSPPRVQSGWDQSEFTVAVGTARLTLECPVESDTELMITWRKAGETIGASWTRYSIGARGRKLRIRNIALVDRGRFSCEAVNGFGRQVVRFIVRVYEGDHRPESFTNYDDYSLESMSGAAPRFVRPDLIRKVASEPLKIKAGHAASLSCEADGQPMPNVIWLKNNIQVGDDSLREQGWKIERTSISKEDVKQSDSAMYTCQVVNMHGQIEATFDLQVQPNNDLHLQPSAFDIHDSHPENLTVPVGGIATFQCKVNSALQPMMRWLRKLPDDASTDQSSTLEVTVNGQPLKVAVIDKSLYNETRIDNTHLTKLVLRNVQTAQSGWYICFVSDLSGNFLHRSALLTVDDGAHIPKLHIILGIVGACVFCVLLCCTFYACGCRQRAKDRALVQQKQQRMLLQPHCATLTQLPNGQTALVYQPPPPTCPPPHTPHLNSYKSSPSPHNVVASSLSSSAYHQFDATQVPLMHRPYTGSPLLYETNCSPRAYATTPHHAYR